MRKFRTMVKRAVEFAVIGAMGVVLLSLVLSGWNGVKSMFLSSQYGNSGYEAEAGTNTFTTVANGQLIKPSHVNQFITALGGDLIPRNTSGVPTTIAGSLGSDTYEWLKAWIESGYWVVGDIKMHHTYNGSAESTCGQGWMLADGRIINETNYNTEHGAGAWAIYVGSSPIDGRYLPDFTAKYPIGVASTAQDGTIAITSVGVTGNTLNLAHTHDMQNHTHSIPSHHHQWLADGQTYNSGGTTTTFTCANTSGWVEDYLAATTNAAPTNIQGVDSSTCDYWTEFWGGTSGAPSNNTTTSTLSASQDIRPESIEVQYCLRIID